MKDIKSSVVPLFREDSKGAVEAYGTGFFLSLNNKKILATAGHVTDDFKKSIIYISNKSGILVPLVTEPYSTELPASGRKYDKIDVGFWVLDSDLLEEIGDRYSFLKQEIIIPNYIPRHKQIVSFICYPATSTKRSKKWSHYKSKTQRNDHIYCVDEVRYKNLGYDSNSHILIEYDLKNMICNGHKNTPKKANGMSGSPILVPRKNLDLKDSNLIGIATTYIRKENLIVATKIKYLIKLIEERLDM